MRILAANSPGEIRIAVMDGNTLENYAIWRPGAPDGLGDLHIGRITAIVPAMAGAFVTLAHNEGFLPNSEGAAGRSEGDYLPVRITRTAQGGKGPRLTSVAAPTAEAPPRLLEPGPSPLARLAAAYPNAPILTDDPALFARLRPQFPDRLTLVPHAFNDAAEEQIDALSTPLAHLPGGLLATITPTPALTAIDMDGGASTAERAEKRSLQFAANRAAIPALVRQIRLRNLSGAILIDLAGIPIKRRPALAPDLAACLAADPARPRLLGFTQLGLAEITRPRQAPPLHELLAGPHAAGLAALREAARNPTSRTRLRAAPAVISALQADPHALPDLARRTTHPLSLQSDPTLPPSHWVIEDQT